jgi:tetratricopeptide (TPR) repeat protein
MEYINGLPISDNLEYKRNLAIYETEIARPQLKLKQPDQAVIGLQKAIEIMIPIAEAYKETTTNLYDLSMAYRLSAEANFQKGNKTEAVKFIDKAITLIQKLKELNSLRETDKNLLAELENEKNTFNK